LLATQNKILDAQVAQQAAQFSHQLGTLLSKLDPNPKDVKTVRHMLRNGTQYEDPLMSKDDYMQASSEEKQQKLMSQSPQLRMKPQRNLLGHPMQPIRMSRQR
jgi:hypothetical protein